MEKYCMPGFAGCIFSFFFYLLLQQVDPEVFAALPMELQEELHSAYRHRESTQAQGIVS